MSNAFDPDYYARTADKHGWGAQSAVLDPERAAYLVESVKGKSILDVGCATGIYVDHLVTNGFAGHGVDFTPAFIKTAKKLYKGDFKVGDAYNLPYKDRSVDTVFLLDILEHIDDKRGLAEARRVAKRRIVIAVPNAAPPELEECGAIFRDYLDTSHLRYYTREMIEELAAKAGGKRTKIRGVAPFAFERFIRETVHFRWRFFNRVFFKLFFMMLRLAHTKTYYSEWLVVIDL